MSPSAVNALYKGPLSVKRRLGTDGKEQPLNGRRYIAMDVHQATISVAVRDDAGRLVMESSIETQAATILDFIHGAGGSLCVTFGPVPPGCTTCSSRTLPG